MTARTIIATFPALALYGLLLVVAGVGVSVCIETARGLLEVI